MASCQKMWHHSHGVVDATKIGVPTYFKGPKLTATFLKSYKKYFSVGKATINKINPAQYARWVLIFVKAKVRWLSKKIIFFWKTSCQKNLIMNHFFTTLVSTVLVKYRCHCKNIPFILAQKQNWDSYVVFTMVCC